MVPVVKTCANSAVASHNYDQYLVCTVELRQRHASLLKRDRQLVGQLDDRGARDAGEAVVGVRSQQLAPALR